MILQARVLAAALAFLSFLGASSAGAQTQPAQQQRAPALNQPATPPAGSGASTAPTTKPVLTLRCEDLSAKFKALDKRGFAQARLLPAELSAADGLTLCPTNPERGIALIEAAYRDLGMQPPR